MKKFILFFLSFLLLSCGHQSATKNDRYRVTAETKTQSNYFLGTLEPLKITNITVPADGDIHEIYFRYGQIVSAGQTLLSLHSDNFQEQFQNALSEWLKMQQSLTNAHEKWESAKKLQKLGLISRNDFNDQEYFFREAKLGFMQSQTRFSALLNAAGISAEKVKNMMSHHTINVDRENQLTELRQSLEPLKIIAPRSGMVLMPLHESHSKVSALTVGSLVKAHEGILVIADLSVLRCRFKANETEVQHLQRHDPVKIKLQAEPDKEILGEIAEISAQAIKQDGNLPMFEVMVDFPVAGLEGKQDKLIGTTANIEVVHTQYSKFWIPFEYIQSTSEGVFAYRWKNGKKEKILLQPGMTTTDTVEIRSGLQEGDELVKPD